jgi:hypothetical protein
VGADNRPGAPRYPTLEPKPSYFLRGEARELLLRICMYILRPSLYVKLTVGIPTRDSEKSTSDEKISTVFVLFLDGFAREMDMYEHWIYSEFEHTELVYSNEEIV